MTSVCVSLRVSSISSMELMKDAVQQSMKWLVAQTRTSRRWVPDRKISRGLSKDTHTPWICAKPLFVKHWPCYCGSFEMVAVGRLMAILEREPASAYIRTHSCWQKSKQRGSAPTCISLFPGLKPARRMFDYMSDSCLLLRVLNNHGWTYWFGSGLSDSLSSGQTVTAWRWLLLWWKCSLGRSNIFAVNVLSWHCSPPSSYFGF